MRSLQLLIKYLCSLSLGCLSKPLGGADLQATTSQTGAQVLAVSLGGNLSLSLSLGESPVALRCVAAEPTRELVAPKLADNWRRPANGAPASQRARDKRARVSLGDPSNAAARLYASAPLLSWPALNLIGRASLARSLSSPTNRNRNRNPNRNQNININTNIGANNINSNSYHCAGDKRASNNGSVSLVTQLIIELRRLSLLAILMMKECGLVNTACLADKRAAAAALPLCAERRLPLLRRANPDRRRPRRRRRVKRARSPHIAAF